jgi:hypothetical protein
MTSAMCTMIMVEGVGSGVYSENLISATVC